MKKEKQYEFVRKGKYGNIYREVCSYEQAKENLRHFYDVVNKIAERMERDGIDTSKYFYSPEQLKEAVVSGKLLPA